MATFSVNDQARRAQGTGNGSATDFSFSFQVNATSDVKVYVGDTLKTLSTHYTIVDSSAAAGLNTDGTGVVKFITSPTDYTPANGDVVTILSDVPVARTSVYTSGGNITAASLESDFDTITMQVADREERDARQLTAPVSDPTSIDMTLPAKADRLGKALGFNSSSGNPEAITFYDSAADVRAAVEAASDSNVFTDADHSKLDGIEANATADQTDAQIRAAVEAATDSNVFTDADHSKLDAIEANATADQTASEIEAIVNHDNLQGIVGNEHIDWTASSAGSIHLTNLPATALTAVQTASSESAMLALTTQEGDVVVRSDENKTYMHNSGSAGTMSDFTLLATPTDSVTSVDGATGAITLNHDTLTGFVSNEHIDWTADQGATNIHSGNYTNTTYSVGDGGLTQNNFTTTLKNKLDAVEASADVTDTTNVTAAGALMDSELTSEASVKAINQGLATSDSPTFNKVTMPLGSSSGVVIGSDDIKIYQAFGESYFLANSGNVNLQATENNHDVIIKTDDGSGGVAEYFKADGSEGEAQLFHYGSEKLATKSTGVDVTGRLQVANGSTSSGYIDLLEDSDNGTNKIKLEAPQIIASNKTITLPDHTGTVGLHTDLVTGDLLHTIEVTSNVSEVEFGSTYITDDYETYDIVIDNWTNNTHNTLFDAALMHFKINGAYATTNTWSWYNSWSGQRELDSYESNNYSSDGSSTARLIGYASGLPFNSESRFDYHVRLNALRETSTSISPTYKAQYGRLSIGGTYGSIGTEKVVYARGWMNSGLLQRPSTHPVEAVRFTIVSQYGSQISGGTFKLYGLGKR